MPRPIVRRHPAPKPTSHTPATAVEAQGAGLEDKTYDELYAMAQEQNIGGRSSMTKDQLIKALQ